MLKHHTPGFLRHETPAKSALKSAPVHVLLRDPLRGGRAHFTERKIDQIRGRLGKFGDLLTEIMRFQGF